MRYSRFSHDRRELKARLHINIKNIPTTHYNCHKPIYLTFVLFYMFKIHKNHTFRLDQKRPVAWLHVRTLWDSLRDVVPPSPNVIDAFMPAYSFRIRTSDRHRFYTDEEIGLEAEVGVR